MKFQFDDNNVPILSREEIESVAEIFLSKYAPENLQRPKKLPVYQVIKKLEKQTELKFDFTEEFGFNPQGKKLGLTKLDDKIIKIDKEFAQNRASKRLYFTIAHEIGHFSFHTNKPILSDGKQRTTIIDTDKEFYFNKKSKDLDTVLDFVEWQANAFASSILLPIQTFGKGLIKIQKEMGINRNRGLIFINKKASSRRDFNTTVTKLSNLFMCHKFL